MALFKDGVGKTKRARERYLKEAEADLKCYKELSEQLKEVNSRGEVLFNFAYGRYGKDSETEKDKKCEFDWLHKLTMMDNKEGYKLRKKNEVTAIDWIKKKSVETDQLELQKKEAQDIKSLEKYWPPLRDGELTTEKNLESVQQYALARRFLEREFHCSTQDLDLFDLTQKRILIERKAIPLDGDENGKIQDLKQDFRVEELQMKHDKLYQGCVSQWQSSQVSQFQDFAKQIDPVMRPYNSSGFPLWAILATCGGGLLLIVVIVVAFMFCRKKPAQRQVPMPRTMQAPQPQQADSNYHSMNA